MAAALSPPPMILVALLSTIASAMARVPASNGGILEHAHRPVPDDGLGRFDDVAEFGNRRGTDIESFPSPFIGNLACWDNLLVAGALEVVPTMNVDWKH